MTTKEKGTLSIGKKTILGIVIFDLLVGGFLAWYFLKPDPAPREVVYKSLKQKSGLSRWKVADSLRQATAPWLELPKALEAATDYKSMYRVLAEHLSYADELLSGADVEKKRLGLRLAMEVARYAGTATEDQWLTARIGEAYFLPNLALCDSSGRAGPNPNQLIDMTTSAIKGSADEEGQFAIYRRHILREKKPHEADWARNQAAILLRRFYRQQEATALTREISQPAAGKASIVKGIKKLEKPLGSIK